MTSCHSPKCALRLIRSAVGRREARNVPARPRKGNEENSIRLYAHVINTTQYRTASPATGHRLPAPDWRKHEAATIRRTTWHSLQRPLRSSLQRLRTQRHLRRPKCRVCQLAFDSRPTLRTSSDLSTKIVHRPVDNLCVFFQAVAAKATFCVAHARTNKRHSGWRLIAVAHRAANALAYQTRNVHFAARQSQSKAM